MVSANVCFRVGVALMGLVSTKNGASEFESYDEDRNVR